MDEWQTIITLIWQTGTRLSSEGRCRGPSECFLIILRHCSNLLKPRKRKQGGGNKRKSALSERERKLPRASIKLWERDDTLVGWARAELSGGTVLWGSVQWNHTDDYDSLHLHGHCAQLILTQCLLITNFTSVCPHNLTAGMCPWWAANKFKMCILMSTNREFPGGVMSQVRRRLARVQAWLCCARESGGSTKCLLMIQMDTQLVCESIASRCRQ